MSKSARGRRWTGWPSRKPSLLRPFPVLRCEELEVRDVPATFIWTGAGANDNWSNPANWQDNIAPTGSLAATDDLVFGAAATKFTSANDLVNPTLNSILFQAGGFTLSGAPVNLGLPVANSGTISVNAGALNNVIQFNTTLTAPGGTNVQTVTVNSGGSLAIDGKLAGTTGATLTKDGPGDLTLSADNSGFTGRIRINAGAVVMTNALALGNTAADTTVGTNASLRIGATVGTVNEPLRLNGPGIVNDGALRLNAAGQPVTWAGAITLDSNAFVASAAGAILNVTGVISDTGTGRNIDKVGQGEVRFNSPTGNTYRGLTTVRDGVLTVGTPTALGTQANGGAGTVQSGTIVSQTLTEVGQLRLSPLVSSGMSVVNEFLTLNGPGPGSAVTPGALANGVGDNLWAGPVTLGSPAPDGKNVVIGVAAATNLTISGVVSSPNGTFSLTKTAPGRLILNNANTYTGTTTVAQGILNVRDSRALGSDATTAGTTVQNGATLELDVESAYPSQPQTDTQGVPLVTRDLGLDSVTGDPNRLFFTEPLVIIGRGVNNVGALHSVSGINVWTGGWTPAPADKTKGIFLDGPINTATAIGVTQDFRPGHPRPSAAYFTEDYSLTVRGVLSSETKAAPNSGTSDPVGDFVDFIKRGTGHLILPGEIANTYTGRTRIEQGWVTAMNKNSLGKNYLPGEVPAAAVRQTTVQPGTYVSAGAAVHIKAATPGGSLTVPENITLQGIGPVHPYAFISQKGALVSIDGTNTWTGDVGFVGQAGVGVEGVIPGSASELTVTGSTTDGSFFYSFTATGAQAEQAFLIDTGGSTSGTIQINYQFYTVPDRLTVYYPPRGPGQIQLIDTGYIPGSKTVDLPFGPGAGTQIEIVINEGGNPNAGTVWDITEASVKGVGGLVKLGDKRLILQGDGTYSGATELREGVLRAQHNTALGQSSTGTRTTQQTYNQTDTIVSSGGVLELVRGTTANNGGVASGLNIFDEKLTLNSPGQQIGVAGAGGTFSLSFRGQTSAPVPITVPATGGTLPTDSLQNTVNALMSEYQTVLVTGAPGDTFTLTFQGQTTAPLPFDAAPAQVEAALNALSTIGGAGGGVVVTAAPSGGGTLFTVNFGIGTLATTNVSQLSATVSGTTTVVINTVLQGLGFGSTVTQSASIFTVVFGGVLDADVPMLTATPFGGAEVTISGGNAALITRPEAALADDHTWHGPVSLAAGARIDTAPNTRISLLGNVDDTVSPTGSDFVKRGTGELILAGTNSFRGETLIDAGILTAASSTAFGSPVRGTEVTGGAQMQIQGSLTFAGEPLTVRGQGVATPPVFPERFDNNSGPTNDGAAPKNLPTSARVTGIAVDTRDQDVIYVATAGGGAWKTKDGGNTWLPLFDSTVDPRAVMYGSQILIDVTRPNILYFATGTADGAPVGQGLAPYGGLRQQDNYAGSGVYTSTDYGVTWTLMTGAAAGPKFNPIAGQAVTKMIQDPVTGLIFVATSNTNLVNGSGTAFAGVYRYDGTAGWLNLTNTVSTARLSTFGQAPFTDPTTGTPPGFGPPTTPGPDDDYRVQFPRNLILQDPDPYSGVRNTAVPGTPAPATWSDIILVGGVLYAALGESNQQWYTGGTTDGSEARQAVQNAVYRLTNPRTANDAAPAPRPVWLSGPNGSGADSRPGGFPIAPFTAPGTSPGTGNGNGVTLPTTIPNPPEQIPQPGRNGYIKLAADVDFVTVAPLTRVVVYATTTYPDWHFLRGQFQDLQRSFDGGSTWTTVNPTFPTQPFGTAQFNPGQPPSPGLRKFNTVPGTGRYNHTILVEPTGDRPTDPSAATVFLGGLTGLYKSTNYGVTWTQLNNPALDATGDGPANQFHYLHIDQSDRVVTGSDGGIWRYDGTTFNDLNGNLAATMLNSADPHPTSLFDALAGSADNGVQQYTHSQAWRRIDDTNGTQGGIVRYDPKNPQIAYAVRDGLLRKTVDGGVNWTTIRNVSAPNPPGAAANPNNDPNNDPLIAVFREIGTPIESGAVNQFPLIVDGQNTNRLLIGGAPGLFESVTGGASFTNLNSPLRPTVIAPATFQGLFVLDPGFNTVTDKLSNTYDPDTIYVSDGTSLAVTKNHGVSWQTRAPAYEQVYSIGFTNGLAGVNVPQLTVTGANGAAATVTTVANGAVLPSGAVIKEAQQITVTVAPPGGAGTFTITGLPGLPAQTFPFSITPLALENAINAAYINAAPPSPNRVVVRGTKLSTITDIAVDPSNRDVAYATVSYPNGLVRNRVFRTTDGGRNWVSINGNLPATPTFQVEIDPRSGTLYVGTDSGVYSLPDARTTTTPVWTRFGTGLANVQVTDMVLNQTLNTLTIGSHGRGMYQLLLTDFQADSGVIRAVSGSSTWTGPVRLTGDSFIGAAGTQDVQNGIAPASLNFVGVISDADLPDGSPGGPYTITKVGLGTVIFSGVNTYSGQTIVDAGVLQVNNPHALGGDPTIPGNTGLNTVVTAGAALELRTDLDSEPVVINGEGITFPDGKGGFIGFNGHFTGALRNVSNDNTYTGELTLGTPHTTIGVDSGSSLTIGTKPPLTGTGRIVEGGADFAWDKELTGTLVLASANTYGGLTLVRQGALQVQHGAALGAAAGGTQVLDGAQVEIARNASTGAATVVPTEPLFLSGTGINNTGALRNVRGIRDLGLRPDGTLDHGVGDPNPNGPNDNTWAGPITLAIDPNTFPQTNPSTQVSIGVSDPRDTLTINTTINQQPGPAAVPGQPPTVPAAGGTAPASLGLIKTGAGRVVLAQPNTGANAFTGVVTVAEGSLRIRNQAALGLPVSTAVQSINIVGTVGTFTLTFNGHTTGTQTLTAATTLVQVVNAVQAALDGLPTVGAGNTLVSGTQSTNGYVLTVTFTGALANVGQPLITAGSSAGLNLFVTTAQQGGTGTVVVPGANLEFDGAPAGGALTVPELITLNGDGLPSRVAVTSIPVPGGSPGEVVYTVHFVGSLENLNQNPLVAIGTNGAVATVATAQDGTATISEIQTVQVVGGGGEFTLTFNGQTTNPIPYGSSPDLVQNELNALLSVGGVGGSGALRQYTGNNTTTGVITLGSDASVGAAASTVLTLAAGLQDPTPLPVTLINPLPAARFRKAGAGTVTLPTANAFGGRTVVDDGVLRATNNLALGNARTEVQSLTAYTGGGNYTLTFNGQTTTALTTASSPTDVQNALLALSTVRHFEVQAVDVTGGAGSFTLTFRGLTTNPIPVNPSANVPALITSELNAIMGAGTVTNVAAAAISGGNRYTITFGGGALAFQDIPQLLAAGTGGAVTAVATVQEGLNGTVAVTEPAAPPVGAAYRYRVEFGGALFNLNQPQLVVNQAAPVRTFVATTTDGQGAETQTLTENATTGTFTLTFNGATTPALPFNATDSQVRAALNALPTLGRADVQAVQVLGTGGTFTLTFNGQTTAALPVGATPGAVQAALNGLRSVGGVGGSVAVTSAAVPDGTVYTVTFGGTLAAADQPTMAAAGAGGATATVATEQDGGGVYVSRAVIAGGFVYTVTFTGSLARENQPPIVAQGTGGSNFVTATANDGPEGTVVNDGATLQLGATAVTTEAVTLNGSGFNGLGALNSSGGASTWSGPVFLGSDASVGTAAAGDSLQFTGPITDGIPGNPTPFGVDVLGPGTVTYDGAVDNRYFGVTRVLGGSLLLNQVSGLAIRGPLEVGGGAIPASATVVRNDQIEDNIPVAVLANGTFNVADGKKDVIDTLDVTVGTVNVGAGSRLTTTGVNIVGGTINVAAVGAAVGQLVLNGNVSATSLAAAPAAINGPGLVNLNGADRTFTVADGPRPVDLVVTAGLTGVSAVPERFIKDGLGRAALAPTAVQTVPIEVRQGDLQVDATQPVGPVQLQGGTLSGLGTVASVAAAGNPAVGTVAPGVNWSTNPVGILRSNGAVVLGPQTALVVNLTHTSAGAPVPGVDHDQLQVTGPISLGSAVLSGTFGTGIAVGDRFTIISATGGVSGRLAQPFGPNVAFVAGQKFFVDYTTSANEVTLQKILARANIALASSANPSTVGQPVTFTATVTPEAGAGSIPAGSTVTFTLDGGAPVVVPLDAFGQATFNPGLLSGGSHTVVATFNGDPLSFDTATTTLIQGVGVPVIDALVPTSLFVSPAPASVGTLDTITFSTNVRGDSATINWLVEVRNASNQVVRSFSGSGTGDPFPIQVTWDGRTGTGTLVPDGAYSVTASFADTTGNSGSTSVTVTVDSTPPSATPLTNATPVIAPGTGSTVPTTTLLSTTVGDANPNGYTVTIRNAGGTVVRTIVGSFAPGAPQQVDVVWDGRNDLNQVVPNGTYTASITVRDQAGNATTPATQPTVVVAATAPAVSVVSASPTIYGQDATFTATVTSPVPAISNLLAGVVVQFVSGAAVIGEAPLVLTGGQYRAVLTVTNLAAGSYPVRAVFAGTTNFLPAASNTINHQVLPATLTVTADSISKVYGDALPPLSFTATGLVNGDTQADVLAGAPTTAATAASDVGTYTIDQGTLALTSANYTLNFVPGTVTVTPAPLTVRADDLTREYGDPNPTPTLTVTGLVNGDTQAEVLSGSPLVNATAASPVGLYTITRGDLAANANYSLSYLNGTLRVTPATLTVIPDSLTKTYGAMVPPRTFTVTGLKNNDTAAAVIAGSLATTATANSPVGVYPISRGSLASTTGNYTLSVVPGATLSVTPAPLTVTADNLSKVYGAAVPPLTFAVTGLVAGDTAAGVLTGTPATDATAGSPVGAFPITQGTLAANGNYALSFGPGTLTVTPAPLTIAVDNAVRRVNTPNPAFTAQFQGLVAGDTSAVVGNLNLTTTATQTSPVGQYPITSATAPVAANYDITVVPGVLTVNTDGTSPPVPPPPGTPSNFTVSGQSNGSARQFNAGTRQAVGNPITPFPGFAGEVRGATADFNGDGFLDTVLVTGPGIKTAMAVVSGRDGSILVPATDPFGDANFTFGGFVTAGDIDGDGRAEWVITPELRGGPRVIIFRLLPDNSFDISSPGQPSLVANFFGIGDPSFRDGDRAALGDVNGDGILDVFSIAAFNGGPRTALYNGADVLTHRAAGRDPIKLVGDFFAAPSGADEGRGGRAIAAGDVDGDGRADLIVTGDNLLGTGNQVTVFSGADLLAGRFPGLGANPIASFTVGGQSPAALVSVAAVNSDGDARADLAVGSGAGQASQVKIYRGTNLTGTSEPASDAFDPFGSFTLNGVFVG